MSVGRFQRHSPVFQFSGFFPQFSSFLPVVSPFTLADKNSQKHSKQPAARSMEELVGSLSAKLDDISNQLAFANKRLDDQADRFDKLEKLLADSQRENQALKTALLNKDDEVHQLKIKLNMVEQHSRSTCIRIFNLDISGDDRDPVVIIDNVYNRVLMPILIGAVETKKMAALPPSDKLILSAHILPGKENKAKPILVRLCNSHARTIIMMNKKAFAPSAPIASNSSGPARQLYPIFEDMTRDSFRTMRAISAHASVQSCWCAGGQLRYRLIDSDTIKKVSDIYCSIEDIIKT